MENFRCKDLVREAVQGVEHGSVSGLYGEIELIEHALLEFLEDGRQVECSQAGHVVMNLAHQPAHDLQVCPDRAPQSRFLDLDRHFHAAIPHCGTVDLSKRGGGCGFLIEFLKYLLDGATQFLFQARPHLFKRKGLDVIPQAFQFVYQVCWKNIRARAQYLADLDESGSQFLDGHPDALPQGNTLMDRRSEPGQPGGWQVGTFKDFVEPVLEEDRNDLLGPDGVPYQVQFHARFSRLLAGLPGKRLFQRIEAFLDLLNFLF